MLDSGGGGDFSVAIDTNDNDAGGHHLVDSPVDQQQQQQQHQRLLLDHRHSDEGDRSEEQKSPHMPQREQEEALPLPPTLDQDSITDAPPEKHHETTATTQRRSFRDVLDILRSWLSAGRRSKSLTLYSVSLALLTDMLVYGVVFPILPDYAIQELGS